jgi:hypothetical protein
MFRGRVMQWHSGYILDRMQSRKLVIASEFRMGFCSSDVCGEAHIIWRGRYC